jgi:DNA-directed RNA polymerase specialized sigma24 family protein
MGATRVICAEFFSVPDTKQNLPQLYRFCFLMTGDARKAQEVFHAALREAAERSAKGELPRDPFWLFRDARWRCLETSEQGLQAEDVEYEEHDLASWAASQIEQLECNQLAIWISGAPDPQRTALALFYLDEFNHSDLLTLTELKPDELAKEISNGRQQFQAWLDTTLPHTET